MNYKPNRNGILFEKSYKIKYEGTEDKEACRLTVSSKNKQRAKIAADVKAFLQNGGEIQQVDCGVRAKAEENPSEECRNFDIKKEDR